MSSTDTPPEVTKYAPPQERMNAAQIQALQEAARKLGEDVALRKWCVEQARLSGDSGPIVDLAERIHRFIVGQSSAGS